MISQMGSSHTAQVTVRPWPKTLYEKDASGAPVPCTCYYYVGMRKKQVSGAVLYHPGWAISISP